MRGWYRDNSRMLILSVSCKCVAVQTVCLLLRCCYLCKVQFSYLLDTRYLCVDTRNIIKWIYQKYVDARCGQSISRAGQTGRPADHPPEPSSYFCQPPAISASFQSARGRVPARALSLLKVPSPFPFKNLLRHYATWAFKNGKVCFAAREWIDFWVHPVAARGRSR